jgi:hypothetical protein
MAKAARMTKVFASALVNSGHLKSRTGKVRIELILLNMDFSSVFQKTLP